jgi:IS30 family transposase
MINPKIKLIDTIERWKRWSFLGFGWFYLIVDSIEKEFSYHKEITRELDIGFYFPKGMSFENITKQQVQDAEDKLNNRPRKRYGFQSLNQVYLQN